ncbi:glyoxalase [Rhodococcus sp. 06-156-3C]|uniref:VOC family protein n=1 Tax=Nocardiaceae TaxID=85025 RepID=UPI000522FE67|nr:MULTISPECIES: VOC family protein [Rhodococcus]OZD05376.1 glyoxalase [Rhodococcus sp. 06-156-4C]OZD16486.1 glyoxalase [Rhodococcus sp. 06-156-4a]OZD26345.1 glyoxalase [Rhodococcus sp. 06-156-3C]OZD31740.1 glyoxalase [Rhodococcus sp. 06-156-3b]OZD35039.1 glyoxalase [Rhodococcus sp. 06-156-3]
MRARKIVTNLTVPDIDAAKGFYEQFLGLETQEFNLGWVARFTAPDGDTSVQLVTRDRTSPVDSVMSVMTDDVDAAYDEAVGAGYEIVRPVTDEPWGVRRFLVRAPDGNVVNIVRHHGD